MRAMRAVTLGAALVVVGCSGSGDGGAGGEAETASTQSQALSTETLTLTLPNGKVIELLSFSSGGSFSGGTGYVVVSAAASSVNVLVTDAREGTTLPKVTIKVSVPPKGTTILTLTDVSVASLSYSAQGDEETAQVRLDAKSVSTKTE